MRVLLGHTDRVRSVAYAPNHTLLASASNDRTIRVWDLATGKERATLLGHKRNVYCVAFSPDGSLLASASGDKTVRLWDVARSQERMVLRGHHTWAATCLAFAPDGRSLATGAGNREGTGPPGEVNLWSLETLRLQAQLPVPGNGAWCLAYTPDGQTLAVGTGYLHHITLWQPAAGTVSSPLEERAGVRALAWAPDGRTLAVAAGWGARLWDTVQSKALASFKGHQDMVWGLAFTPGGRTLFTGSRDGVVKVWDVAAGREQAALDWQIGKVHCVAVAGNGMTAAAGGETDIVVWDVDDLAP